MIIDLFFLCTSPYSLTHVISDKLAHIHILPKFHCTNVLVASVHPSVTYIGDFMSHNELKTDCYSDVYAIQMFAIQIPTVYILGFLQPTQAK